jgi:hypothetical protein
MPVHDWTLVDAGLFHDFHQAWIISLRNALNRGVLPPDYFALAEQSIRGPVPDVLSLRLSPGRGESSLRSTGLAVAEAPPRARIVRRAPEGIVYARKADRVSVRHRHGQIVAVIEIVSPGNKSSITELRAFIDKSLKLLQQGVHVLVIDLFPPSKRDPEGIHKAIWDEIDDAEFELPDDQPLTLAAYDAGPPPACYVEPVGVGEMLTDMPLFLQSEFYVLTPLEATYQTAWGDFPAVLKGLLEGPAADQAEQD